MPTIKTIDGVKYVAINGHCYNASNLTVLPTIKRTVYGQTGSSEYVVGIKYEVKRNNATSYYFPQTSRSEAWSIARKIKALIEAIKEER